MEIRADGTWFYMGTPIGRAPLVRLFSTVLRKDEDGKTYLVTPVEKVGIRVEDAPFVAVEMNVAGEEDGEQVLTFRTNVGDVVEAGPDIRCASSSHGENSELKPYLHVRGRLEALVARAVMYDLVALRRGDRDRRRRRCLPCAPAARSFPSCRPTNWTRCRNDRDHEREPFTAADFRRRALDQMGEAVADDLARPRRSSAQSGRCCRGSTACEAEGCRGAGAGRRRRRRGAR